MQFTNTNYSFANNRWVPKKPLNLANFRCFFDEKNNSSNKKLKF